MSKKHFQRVLPEQRVEEFMIFCNKLEQHPFFKEIKSGKGFQLKVNFSDSDDDLVALSFDEYHLESYLARLRQFFFRNELFHYKQMQDDITNLFGSDEELDRFFSNLEKSIHRKVHSDGLHVYKEDGKDVVVGFNLLELMEAMLYTGALHSERRLTSEPGSSTYGLASAPICVTAHLAFCLASYSVAASKNIFATRNQILRLARSRGWVGQVDELVKYDQRARAEGR